MVFHGDLMDCSEVSAITGLRENITPLILNLPVIIVSAVGCVLGKKRAAPVQNRGNVSYARLKDTADHSSVIATKDNDKTCLIFFGGGLPTVLLPWCKLSFVDSDPL